MPIVATTAVRTTTTNVNLLQDIFLFKRFIETLRKDLILLQLAREDKAPMQVGLNFRWNFWQNPTAATTPLGEGADPTDSEPLVTTKVEAGLLEFGDFFEITDLLEETAISGTMTGFVDAAAYQAQLTIDDLLHTTLATSTNTQNAGTALKADDLRIAYNTLRGANVKPHPGTPGGQFYCAVTSVEAATDMIGEGNPNWSQVKREELSGSFVNPLMGTPASSAVYGCIIKQSTNVKRDTGPTPEDDINFVLGKEGFGVSPLGNRSITDPQVMIVPPTPSLASPLGRRGTVGWKVKFARALFDSTRAIKLLTDATGT